MKRLAVLMFLLLPSSAFAAKTAYIRTACTNNGDGTASSCAGSPGGVGAYTTCANAITGEVAANANLSGVGILTLNAAGTTADTACNINGFSGMDATHLVRLQGDFTGVAWSTSLYRLDEAKNGGLIEVNDPYVEILNVQIRNSTTGGGNTWGIHAAEAGGSLSLKVGNCLIVGASGSGGPPAGIHFRPDVANSRGVFYNNIIYGFTQATAYGMRIWGSGGNSGEIMTIYNNTVHGSPIGIGTHGGGSSDALYLKNNIVQSCSTNCYLIGEGGSHTTYTNATNLSEDTSSPNNTWDSKVVTFVSETGGSEDLHLGAGDTAAKDQGTDLSADAIFPFSTDVDGATRTGTWDIGADEITTATAKTFSVLNAMGED